MKADFEQAGSPPDAGKKFRRWLCTRSTPAWGRQEDAEAGRGPCSWFTHGLGSTLDLSPGEDDRQRLIPARGKENLSSLSIPKAM